MVKQEIARLNIDILGISELKWMGMGEFNSEESLRRLERNNSHSQQKNPKCSTWVQPQK